jgi:hypothetical protein
MAVELGANTTSGHVILISDESQRGDPLGAAARENKSVLNKGAAPQLSLSSWLENSLNLQHHTSRHGSDLINPTLIME